MGGTHPIARPTWTMHRSFGVITVHRDGDLAVGDAPGARLGFWIARPPARGDLGDAIGAAVDLLERDGHPATTAQPAPTNTRARRALEARVFDAVAYRRTLAAGRASVAARRPDVASAE